MSERKTNVMRLLDRAKIPYQTHTYPHGDQPVDGVRVAELLGEEPACVFKTLVTQGADRQYYVFVIPVERELNLKQAAKAAAVKSISMIPMGDLLKVTGYIRGGCSPIGMKKTYPTFFDESAKTLSHIIVSAGKIGQQIDLKPDDLLKMTGGRYAAVTGV